MKSNVKPLEVPVVFKDTKFTDLFYSGATHNFLQSEQAIYLDLELVDFSPVKILLTD